MLAIHLLPWSAVHTITASTVEVCLHEGVDARSIAEACVHGATVNANSGMALFQTGALTVTNLPSDNPVLCAVGIRLLRNVNYAICGLLFYARGWLVKATWLISGSEDERDHLELDLSSKVSKELRQVGLAEDFATWSFHAVERRILHSGTRCLRKNNGQNDFHGCWH